jgi:hypothetical protein
MYPGAISVSVQACVEPEGWEAGGEGLYPVLWNRPLSPCDRRSGPRPAVLWRKGSFGSDSEAGSRFAERLLTVVASCRQQGRPLLAFLVARVEAALRGSPPPSLRVPQGGCTVTLYLSGVQCCGDSLDTPPAHR